MTRKMFSDDVTASDAFLDMPQSSQLLYFHLGMSADDDGFIANPKMTMRVLGSNEDDIRILFSKKFLLKFESGVCVIKHWRINNYIRKDIYSPTRYITEKRSLYIRKNGAYTLQQDDAIALPEGHFSMENIASNKDIIDVDEPSTSRARDVHLGKVRLGKVSIDTRDTAQPSKTFKAPTLEEVIAYCSERKNTVDPQKWLDHYTSNGWKVGRNSMKDWRAAVRTWEKNRFDSLTPQKVFKNEENPTPKMAVTKL